MDTAVGAHVGIGIVLIGAGMIFYDFYDVKDETHKIVDPLVEQQKRNQIRLARLSKD